jgi:7-carboxy-7-deazaguanine synthase
MQEGVLPLAEKFISVQGEGQWVGTLMLFVRLAGCNVGRPAAAVKAEQHPFPVLPNGREAMACTTYDGRTFPCDTDYLRSSTIARHEIVDEARHERIEHVCITGGEPMMYADKLLLLADDLRPFNTKMHIETSGTIMPPKVLSRLIMPDVWITVSPKIGALDEMINRSDELKLLVDDSFDMYKLTQAMLDHRNVFLCPINGVDEITKHNVEKCCEIQRTMPWWRISFQVHKLFGWR